MIPDSLEVLDQSWHPKHGCVRWKNQNGFVVVQVHYSADPHKDKAWAEAASTRYPGGMRGRGWQAEMEIDWQARSGGRIYPDFSLATHVIEPTEIPATWPRFRAIDPGFHNPMACLWVAINPDDDFIVYRELYESGWTIERYAAAVKGMTGREKIEFTVVDPSAFAKTLASSKSIADQFAYEGVFMVPGDNRVKDGIAAVQKLMVIQDYGQPRLRVLGSCPCFIREHINYRYKILDGANEQRRDEYEDPIKKDDHTCDAFRYLVMATPENYMRSIGRNDPFHVGRQPSLHERALRQARERASERVLGAGGWDFGF